MIRSLLSVVQEADNLPPHPHSPYPTHSPDGSERYVPFHLTFADFQAGLPPIGLLRPAVVRELRSQISSNEGEGESEGAEVDDEGDGNVWQMYITVSEPATSNVENGSKRQRVGETQAGGVSTGREAQAEEGEDLDMRVDCVFFSDWVLTGGPERISSVLADIVGRWKAEGKFPGPLAGWRDEQYQLYYPSSSTAPSFFPSTSPRMIGGTMSNKAFTLERAACAIFGLPTYGVHMTAYEGEGDGMKVWVPKRAATKATWPGKLDNTVAGGITAGMRPLETMIKECDEEANLPEDFVRARLKNAGVVTYFYITEDGYLQPEVEYIYDLPLPPQSSPEYIKPRPHDDEVESFALLDLPTIREHLFAGDFKPNCGAILVDFLLRHGCITPENEPYMLEIRWSLARQLGLAMPA